MLRLRQNLKSCRPASDGSFDARFYNVERVLSQTTGQLVIQRSPIPKSVFRHEGETADMYSLDNLLKLGVSLQPVTQRYGSITLEERSQALEAFDTFAPQYDAELQLQQSQTTE